MNSEIFFFGGAAAAGIFESKAHTRGDAPATAQAGLCERVHAAHSGDARHHGRLWGRRHDVMATTSGPPGDDATL